MDAIELLKKDHRTVEELFSKYQGLGDRAHKTKRQTVDRITKELKVHTEVEEKLFYPAVREAISGADDLVLESHEEHHVVDVLLRELGDTQPGDERFDAKVTVLMENVQHHVEEEESEMFPKFRKALGSQRLNELGNEMASLKKDLAKQL